MKKWAFSLLLFCHSVHANAPKPFLEFIGVNVKAQTYKKKKPNASISSDKPLSFLLTGFIPQKELSTYHSTTKKPSLQPILSISAKPSLDTIKNKLEINGSIVFPEVSFSQIKISSDLFTPSIPENTSSAPQKNKEITPRYNHNSSLSIQKTLNYTPYQTQPPKFVLDTAAISLDPFNQTLTHTPSFNYLFSDFITVDIDSPKWEASKNPYLTQHQLSSEHSQNKFNQSKFSITPPSFAHAFYLSKEPYQITTSSQIFFEHNQRFSPTSALPPQSTPSCNIPIPDNTFYSLKATSNTSTAAYFCQEKQLSPLKSFSQNQTPILDKKSLTLPHSSITPERNLDLFSFKHCIHAPCVAATKPPLHTRTKIQPPSPHIASTSQNLMLYELNTFTPFFSNATPSCDLAQHYLPLLSNASLSAVHPAFVFKKTMISPYPSLAPLQLTEEEKLLTLSNQSEQLPDHSYLKQLTVNNDLFVILLPNLSEDPFAFNRSIPLTQILLPTQSTHKQFFNSINNLTVPVSSDHSKISQQSLPIFGRYTPQYLSSFFTSPVILVPLNDHEDLITDVFSSPDLLVDKKDLCTLNPVKHEKYAENINEYQRKTKGLLTSIPSPETLETHDLSNAYFTQTKVIQNKKEGTYIFKTMLKPQPDPKMFELPHTFTFLIDQSHSVGAKDYETFKVGVISALKYINKNAKFNIVLLGDTEETFATSPVKPTKKQIQKAYMFLKNRKIGTIYGRKNPYLLTGTIQRLAQDPNALHTFIFLTNNVEMNDIPGETEKVSKWIALQNKNFDFHIATIHNNENSAILSFLSKLGKGTMVTSKTFASFPRRLCLLVKKMKTPLLQNVSVTPIPRSDQNIKLYLSQQLSPNIYDTKPYSIYGSTNMLSDIDLYIQGTVGENVITIRKTIPLKNAKSGSLSFIKTVEKKQSQLHMLRFLQAKKHPHLKSARDLFQYSIND